MKEDSEDMMVDGILPVKGSALQTAVQLKLGDISSRQPQNSGDIIKAKSNSLLLDREPLEGGDENINAIEEARKETQNTAILLSECEPSQCHVEGKASYSY